MVKLCKLLYQEILKQQEIRGKVISSFSNSFNVLSNDKIITVLNSSEKIQPFSIAGEKITVIPVVDDEITINERGIYLSGSLICLFDELVIYDPFLCLNYRSTVKKIADNFLKLERLLLSNREIEGIATVLYPHNYSLTKGYEYIVDEINDWLNYYQYGQKTQLKKKSVDICGFGYGLTPSCDDFLAGVMLCDLMKDIYENKNTANKIKEYSDFVHLCKNKTNKISLTLLENSAQGMCNEVTKNLLQALFSQEDILEQYAKKMLKIGHCSGADMLCGILTAYKYAKPKV
ncbi:MAG: DUF2877 domain-containing protein [Erysipelotrichia bacterium]|nr:DUF2877 domain-containing protein [Erysipelotrichia bacterium]